MIRQLLYVLILALAPWRCWSQTSSVEEQARRQIEQGDLEQAEATLRPYLKLHDGNALACYLLGVALSGRGKRDESDRYLKKALTADFDGDGWSDIFVTCDSTSNILYRNNKNGTYTDVGLIS